MSNQSEILDSVMDMAKAAHQFNSQLVKAGIDTTDALIKEFTKDTEEEKTELSMEEAIRDRLVNGFKNWNGGYDGWLEWCNTLYEPDVHYNVYGKRLTLPKCSDTVKKTR